MLVPPSLPFASPTTTTLLREKNLSAHTPRDHATRGLAKRRPDSFSLQDPAVLVRSGISGPSPDPDLPGRILS